ncbi:beta-1,3-galactosyltransferase 2-like [Hyperolius riggenbachi]|uniref:beta-1,3-galactosyltransferase 2-like n=1 Tax=Hyperolius riggenbachi TaxID=752182 RepID=UPI0035A3A69D
MPSMKGACNPCGAKNMLKLFLALLTLTLLSFTFHVIFPSLVSTDLQNSNIFSVLAKNIQVKQSISSSLNSASQPETKSTGPTINVYDYIINEPDKCQGDGPFLVLLIAGERWQKEARQAIRQTWGKEDFIPGVKILRLFILGKDDKRSEDAQQGLLKESQEHHDIIQQDYLDTYRNLTLKVLMGFYWVATYCPKALYVMKTDTDMFVNTEYLIKTILKPDQPPRQDYFTGHLMRNAAPIRDPNSKWSVSQEEYPRNSYPLFCSGTGYVFSANLASKIVNISPTVRWLPLEDVYVGLCLEKLGVKPAAPPKTSDFNNWSVHFSNCTYNHIVTAHYVNPGQIIRFWNMVQKNKHTCNKSYNFTWNR